MVACVLLAAGHNSIHIISQLKKGAMLSDFRSLIDNVRQLRGTLDKDTSTIDQELMHMKQEVHELLNDLESHYYSSKNRGPLPAIAKSSGLSQLSALALQVPSVDVPRQ